MLKTHDYAQPKAEDGMIHLIRKTNNSLEVIGQKAYQIAAGGNFEIFIRGKWVGAFRDEWLTGSQIELEGHKWS